MRTLSMNVISVVYVQHARAFDERNQCCLRSVDSARMLIVLQNDVIIVFFAHKKYSLLRKTTVEPLMSHELFYRCPCYASVR